MPAGVLSTLFVSLILTTTTGGSNLSIVILEMRKLRLGKDRTCAKSHTDGKESHRIQTQGQPHPAPELFTAASDSAHCDFMCYTGEIFSPNS